MTYIENVFFCLSAPLIVAIVCADGDKRRPLLFMLTGMIACLFSAYISSFLAMAYETDTLTASLEITPVVEEIMKMLPILFFLLVFEPYRKKAVVESLMVAVGFATLENTCYLIDNGANDALRLLIRGFSTGAMHVACGAITAIGLTYKWDRWSLRVAVALGTLCMAITWHGVFNILVSQTGTAAIIGYALPILTGIGSLLFRHRFFPDSR